MGFLTGPLGWIARMFIKHFVNKLLAKLMEIARNYQEKKQQDVVTEENLQKVKESKSEPERIKNELNLINGTKSNNP